jgi:nucleoside 2-deoxyribosyltransferase
MKIYLASSLSQETRPDMYRVLKELRELGHDVYGPVEHTIKNAWDYSNQDWGRLVFEEDIRAINAADCIVAISYGRTKTTAGSSWEIGYAYGTGKKVVVVEMDEGPQSLMVSNGSHATVKGLEGLIDYDFASMPRLMTEAEQK